ncbi:hypothetical protein SAMN04487895_10376 [Paenibacillus sophorae]|uniref:PIN domain-containing protein n=1 Tax=Paenibacillus sophorae TaxID=1333845 RepID=A0A1H8JLW3_9BACL|nr:hypothetical protein [Paenibacillus sophorae]QWU18564.1 hypothetical protein KP014_15525 [Paenibacillus sophorae]SEN81744.1 hypothetical protein SAMN04487895_10376 [Paenibacillus sophorae]
MSDELVISYEDARTISFHQASVNIDACFLLAYIDSDDSRGDKVAEILDQWSDDGIEHIGISNHVVGEVIHNIFKNRIRQVLSLAYKKYKSSRTKRPYTFNKEEESIIGDYRTADYMRSIVPERALENLISRNELSYSIEILLKEYKSRYPTYTEHLTQYYSDSTLKFNETINGLRNDLGIPIIFPYSDESVMWEAFESTSTEQLGIYDAFHMAISRHHNFDYFATLDGDFVSNYLNIARVTDTKIIKVA